MLFQTTAGGFENVLVFGADALLNLTMRIGQIEVLAFSPMMLLVGTVQF